MQQFTPAMYAIPTAAPIQIVLLPVGTAIPLFVPGQYGPGPQAMAMDRGNPQMIAQPAAPSAASTSAMVSHVGHTWARSGLTGKKKPKKPISVVNHIGNQLTLGDGRVITLNTPVFHMTGGAGATGTVDANLNIRFAGGKTVWTSTTPVQQDFQQKFDALYAASKAEADAKVAQAEAANAKMAQDQNAAAIASFQAQNAQALAAAGQGQGQTKVEKLKELAELRTQGILTDEEFAAEKAKILAA
jgi:hypothetical protein